MHLSFRPAQHTVFSSLGTLSVFYSSDCTCNALRYNFGSSSCAFFCLLLFTGPHPLLNHFSFFCIVVACRIPLSSLTNYSCLPCACLILKRPLPSNTTEQAMVRSNVPIVHLKYFVEFVSHQTVGLWETALGVAFWLIGQLFVHAVLRFTQSPFQSTQKPGNSPQTYPKSSPNVPF